MRTVTTFSFTAAAMRAAYARTGSCAAASAAGGSAAAAGAGAVSAWLSAIATRCATQRSRAERLGLAAARLRR
jgi:hypothetical protein